MGYSRKYPHPLWTTLNWVPISGLLIKTVAVYAGFQTLLIQILGEFQKFVHGIPVRQTEQSITGFPMSSMGCVWIFSGIAQCDFVKQAHHLLLRIV